MNRKFDSKGVEINNPLKASIIEHLIETSLKTANMVKALTAVNLKIDPSLEKGFELSPIK